MLAELGADVVRVDRPGESNPLALAGGLRRSRPSIAVDLKTDAGRAVVQRLVDGADVLVEGYRPGVVERLGLGPDECLARNPRLVHARMTGWGQSGPWAQRAGHDITYAAVSGTLHALGTAAAPGDPGAAGRRLRGRVALPRGRGALGADRPGHDRAGSGRRRRDGRRGGPPVLAGARAARHGRLARRARGQPARRWRTVLRGLRVRRRAVRGRGGTRAAVLGRARRRPGGRGRG